MSTPQIPSDDQLKKVSNPSFIASIFKHQTSGATPIVCTKDGDPNQGGWSAHSAQTHADKLKPDRNNFVNCASFRPDGFGFVAAKNEQFAAYHFVLLDDVGTKVPRAKLGSLIPTWCIETSPGNFQMGIVLTTPIQGLPLAKRLQAAIAAKGLSDPGAHGANRWARLPVGINGKEKHRDSAGQPFQCRLVEFNADQTYSVEQLIEILGLDWTPEETAKLSSAPSPVADRPRSKVSLGELKALLDQLDPNMGRSDWIRVLMAVWHETEGSEDGFALVNRWSSGGKSYGGTSAMRVQWNSFGPNARPVTVGTLIHMVHQAGGHHEEFTVVESEAPFATEAVLAQESVPHPKNAAEPLPLSVLGTESMAADKKSSPLLRFAVTNDVTVLERNVVGQRFVMGELALAGQSTVLYASPNTGKTLITLQLLCEAVSTGDVDPRNLYYINMDDSASGLLEKSRLAQDLGFHMIGTGYNGFSPTNFRVAMEEMVRTDAAKGVVVVLDTLKKFVNLMHKEQSSEFAGLIRQFTTKGGTVIALAHANKRPDAEGNPVYSGTTDIVDDSDCAYTIKQISDQDGCKVVEFTNIKRRGDVVASAWYRYSTEKLTYAARLQSVQAVQVDDVLSLKQEAALASESPVIDAITSCIREGIQTKMVIAKEVANRCRCSRKQAIQVLEKHTGDDPTSHRWHYEVRARGAQFFVLNTPPNHGDKVSQPVLPSPGISELGLASLSIVDF